MAELPYTPFPSVEPTSGEIGGGSFGGFGAAASGLGNLGDALIQGGATIQSARLRTKGMTNDLFANDAVTAAMKRFSQAYGEFARLEGKASNEALPGFQKTIDQIYNETVQSMPNLDVKLRTSNALRSLSSMYYRYGESYAAGQFKSWQDKSYGAAAQEYGTQAMLAVNNPEQMYQALYASDQEVRELLSIRGYDEEYINTEVAANRGNNVKGIVSTLLASGDVRGAAAMFGQFEDEIDGANRVEIANSLRTSLNGLRSEELVDRAVGRTSYRPELHAAQIRQESGGDQTAVSPKGAGGLMQLMPETAKMVAAELGLPYDQALVTADTPEGKAYNIALGTHYMETQLAEFGNETMALAAYNAGPGMVEDWINGTNLTGKNASLTKIGDFRNGDISEAEWIEKIPFKETREYVKAILGGADAMPEGEVPGMPNKADALQYILDATEGNPQLRTTALGQLEQRYRVEEANWQDQVRQKQLFEAARKEADDAASLEYTTDMLSPDPQHTMLEIAQDQRLSDESIRELFRFQKAIESADRVPASVSQETTSELFARINLPTDDPRKVKTLDEINLAFEQQRLSKDDYKFLVDQYQNTLTPEGQELSAAKGDLLAAAKAVIVSTNDLGFPTPSGSYQYYLFQKALAAREAEYRKAGKSLYDLYDEMGQLSNLATYQTSLSEQQRMLMDRYSFGQPEPTPEPVVEEPTAESPASALVPFAPPFSGIVQGLIPLVQSFQRRLIQDGVDERTANELTIDYADGLQQSYDSIKVVPRREGETSEEWDRRRNTGETTPEDLGRKLDALESILE